MLSTLDQAEEREFAPDTDASARVVCGVLRKRRSVHPVLRMEVQERRTPDSNAFGESVSSF